MATCKHTPGPWAVRPRWRDPERFEVFPVRETEFGEPATIAEVTGHSADEDEFRAEAKRNARLISAAPDFYRAALLHREYEALRNDRGGMHGPKGKAYAAWREAESVALEKAEG